MLQAFEQDQQKREYETYEELLNYCRCSANPVGRLVLCLFGVGDPVSVYHSDCVCTGLQLANFWQDVARDYSKGRIYIPVEDMKRFGYSEEELARGAVTDAFRDLIAYEVARARDLFDRGMGLIDTLGGRIKLDVALFSLGGMKVLDAIERQRFDVLSSRPKVSRAAKMRLLASATVRIWLIGGLKPRRY